MKHYPLFWLLAALSAGPVLAQEPEDTTRTRLPSWESEMIGRLSASQAGYRNWAEGGINTLSSTASIQGTAERTSTEWLQKHEWRLSFGIVRQDTLDIRKAEDLIRLAFSQQYRGEGFFRTFNPILALTVRSQFAPGFNYEKNPLKNGWPLPVKVSDLLSPATFTQSLGLTYDPNDWLTQRLGLAGKETIVLIERLRPLYGVDPEGAVRVEMGLESKTQVDKEIFEDVRYQSSLGLFAAFNQPDVPDVLWENLVIMKVNEWLGVNFEFAALYDSDIDSRMQLKEILSVGVTYKIL